ncbi:hypothetical protein KP509_08G011900 [Ceratopteris richardii]|uniref:ARM repeat superfamily protein n=2 Tax=Ceratopteris richardii TaxID=49495 RepID=A0A8T2UE37_CERRI|nr:hypothetical protein KP509_08G011900 [Ceratopteris richardii]
MPMDVDTLDISALQADASMFFTTSGPPSEAVVNEFLKRYELPALFRGLEFGDEFTNILIPILEKIFHTHAGAIALLQSLPYAVAGLGASSASVRRMTCLGISKLIEHSADDESMLQTVTSSNLIVLVLNTASDSDDRVASAGMEVIQNLAKTSFGINVLFTGKSPAADRLKELIMHGSSLVRIRIFAMIACLLKNSSQAVSAIKESGVFKILELELCNKHDILAQMNALELLHEIASTPIGANFVIDGGFLQQLISIMSSTETDGIVRSRSMMVGARLISPEDSSSSIISKHDAMSIIGNLNSFLETLESSQRGEKEAVFDALGRIGMSKNGAELLFEASSGTALLIEAAVGKKGGSDQLVAIHALASIAGSERADPLLSNEGEALLRDLIFTAREKLSRRPLSELIQWLLQQPYETRRAVYRLIISLAPRPWFVLDICPNKEIINFLTDPHSEKSKEGMEWRHACCVAVSRGLFKFDQSIQEQLQEVIAKVQAAVARGPYLAREKVEARPLVVTQERF